MTVENESFVAAALAASDDCIKIIGLDGTLQYMSDGGQRVMEVDDFDALKGCPWPDFWHGQGNIDAVTALAEASAGRSARFTGFANTAKGNRRFWDVKVSPIFGPDGSVESLLSISRDITALRTFEEQQSILRNELSHRIKNIIALVQAVANQTLKDGDQMSVARPAFLSRLVALGRAHDLLMHSSDTKTTVRAVTEAVAGEQHQGRIKLAGPEIELSARSGLALALALHELATNAVKYGALSGESGHVNVGWIVEERDGEKLFELAWEEGGGPAVVAPTRKGFGSRMIERALASYVQGHADMFFPPSGLVFRLQAPLDNLIGD